MRIIVILFLVILLIGFFGPLRDFLNKQFFRLFKEERQRLTEKDILGSLNFYNPKVEEIQRILKEKGFDPGPVDGRMGYRTRYAIREFQKDRGLRPTGKVDSSTWQELMPKKEVIEEEVETKEKRIKKIQTALQNAGFYRGKIDGKFGPRTRGAVREFQRAKGLKVDGIVGPKTWEELRKYLKE